MMILIRKLTVLILFAGAIISCTKKDDIVFSRKNTAFELINDNNYLKSRIQYINKPIQFSNLGKTLGYTLVASIESPVINGQKLSATCVSGTFGHAYVGFHSRGNNIGGELLSIDVTVPEEPVIIQSAQSENFEVNDLFVSFAQPKLWICGDCDHESTHKAYAMEFDLNNNLAHSEQENWTKYSSTNSGNSITEVQMNNESHLWFTSGKKGGLEVFPASNPQEIIMGFNATNTKHFDTDGQFGVVVMGIENNLSIVRVYDLNNNYSFVDYEIPYTLNTSGKNGICVKRNQAYIAMGSDGLIVMDLINGEIISTFKNTEGTANSVFVEKDYIYLAYGSAGLFIIDQFSFESIGNYNYDGSCNFVFVDHEMIYLANGDGDGFLILKKD